MTIQKNNAYTMIDMTLAQLKRVHLYFYITQECYYPNQANLLNQTGEFFGLHILTLRFAKHADEISSILIWLGLSHGPPLKMNIRVSTWKFIFEKSPDNYNEVK